MIIESKTFRDPEFSDVHTRNSGMLLNTTKANRRLLSNKSIEQGSVTWKVRGLTLTELGQLVDIIERNQGFVTVVTFNSFNYKVIFDSDTLEIIASRDTCSYDISLQATVQEISPGDEVSTQLEYILTEDDIELVTEDVVNLITESDASAVVLFMLAENGDQLVTEDDQELVA